MKSINNIFEIIKADRYTADGRDKIIKAQGAETEDARRYKIGEISEATGLQKQPDGSWAPPKKGATAGVNNEKAKQLSKFEKMRYDPTVTSGHLRTEATQGSAEYNAELHSYDKDTPHVYVYKDPNGDSTHGYVVSTKKMTNGEHGLEFISEFENGEKVNAGAKQDAGISKSGVDTAHEDKDRLDKALKKQSMPAMAETLENMDFESEGVKTVNGTNMEVFKKDYGSVIAVAVTWQKGNKTGSATKIFNKGREQKPTGVLHNMNIHGVIWS